MILLQFTVYILVTRGESHRQVSLQSSSNGLTWVDNRKPILSSIVMVKGLPSVMVQCP